ncbi:hypothetical protein CC117_12955 [Parafrankia colletiae]|uniref:AMIN-like domain-containing protein n=1 Tax=Parafrankia colletiae TaxID=573497 RepID=A0A1S1R2F9_9ACTN|nr:hypothetical protein [Parafrankia colletiae]MCK9901565.1 hypothetical protein [Frankia sp. Cpl3]OHV41113.1 hypothetical protein CC117_12955 [Parafrankia colletiae]
MSGPGARTPVGGGLVRAAVGMFLTGVLLGLVSCGGGSDNRGSGGGGSAATASPAPSASRTSAPSTVPPSPAPSRTTAGPAPAPSPTDAPRPVVWSSEPRRVDRALPGSATVVGVRSGHNVAVGVAFDRLVIEFADQVPGYDVRYVPDVRSPGEGAVVALRGQAFMEVVLFSTVAHDEAGNPTLRTPSTGGGHPSLVQYRITGDYEGYVHLGLGVDDRVGFRVLELSNPPRLAIDLAA